MQEFKFIKNMLPKIQESRKHMKFGKDLYEAAIDFCLQLPYGNGESESDRGRCIMQE